ncbi:hypothetical protein D1872_338580 [compost metagenome]
MHAGRRTVPGGAYDSGQYRGATHDGPPPGHVNDGRLPVIINLGMATRPGGYAAFRTAHQRL